MDSRPLPTRGYVNTILTCIQQNNISDFEYYYPQYGYTIDRVCENGCTFLSWAVRTANLASIKQLIQKGAPVTKAEKDGVTPLVIATYLGRLDVIQLLLEHGANITDRDKYDNSLLSIAIQEGHADIIQYLRDEGLKTDNRSLSFFLYATNENRKKIVESFIKDEVVDFYPRLFFAAIRTVSIELIEYLLKHGVKVNDYILEKTPVTWAAEDGHLEVVKMLVSNGADVNKLNPDGNTSLAMATKYRQLEIVKYLTDISNICKVGPNGKTPLLWAVQNKDFELVKWFLKNGAEYILDDVFLNTIELKNLKLVQLFVEAGALIRRKTKNNKGIKMTPLKQSLEVESREIAQYLLDKGANLEKDLDNDEITYLVKFLESNVEMAKLLIENGARLNISGKCGHTSLTKAIKMDNLEMVKFLVEHGSNVSQADKNGLTPLGAAGSNDNVNIFQFLVERGASVTDAEAKNEKITRFYQIAKKNCLKKKRQVANNFSQEAANDA